MSANHEDPRYRRIASVRERERLNRECAGYRRILQGKLEIPTHRGIKEGVPTRRKAFLEQFIDSDFGENKHGIMNHIRKRERFLERVSPQQLSRKEKTVLEKQTQRDSAWLKRNMGSRKLMATKANSPDFEKAVESCQREDDKMFQSVAGRYKNCMRQLDPDNPNSSNIERLRK